MPRYCTHTQYKQAHDDVLNIILNNSLDSLTKLDVIKKKFSVIISLLNHSDKTNTLTSFIDPTLNPSQYNYAEAIYKCQEILNLENLDSNSTSIIHGSLEYVSHYVDLKYQSVSKTEFENKLDVVLEDIRNLLVMKNRKYGNSALEPARVFSRADPVEQIKVRLDDKISRLKNQQPDEDEDVIQDILGYLILLKIAQRS